MKSISRRHQGKRIEIWFEDEARFGQQGSVSRFWARRGSRPRAVRQTGFEWLYVLSTVCPTNGQTAGLLSPYIDAGIINIFFQQFSEQLADDVHAVLIWDQAGFHKSKELIVPENISIIELPAYSPELNPVENLWQYLRSHYWSNRSYEGYDDLRQAAVEAWQKSALNPEIIKSVCRAKYVERNV